jgi:hypothetical protein
MGNHSSTRADSGQRRGWRVVGIVGAVVGFGYATVGVVGLASGTTPATPSVYSAITPVTVLGRSLAAGSNTDVTVAGVDGVPSNATSVQLSVTALGGTTTSSMYVYPTGATKPTSANVRWATGETITIPVTVAVGTSGKVRLSTDGGTVTVKVAVVGYFSPEAGGAAYATTAANVGIGTQGAVIASLVVPAGTYELQARATLGFSASAGSDVVSCNLTDPADNSVGFSATVLNISIYETSISLLGLDTTTGGTINVTCDDLSEAASATDVALVATQVSSATGNVTSG